MQADVNGIKKRQTNRLTFLLHSDLKAESQATRLTVLALLLVDRALVVVQAHEVLLILDAASVSVRQ